MGRAVGDRAGRSGLTPASYAVQDWTIDRGKTGGGGSCVVAEAGKADEGM